MVSAPYGEAMTILVLLAGLAAVIVTTVGYVAWRERRSRGSFIDPSVSRGVLAEVHRQAVRGRLAEADMLVVNVVPHGPGTRSRADGC